MLSMVDKIIAYENGEMDEEEEIAFFQELLDTGLVFQLQGHYQRQLQYHLNCGNVRRKSTTDTKDKD